MLQIKQSVAKSLRLIFVDATDLVTRETGILYSDLTVKYLKYGDTTPTTKTVLTGDFRHLYNGVYELDFTAAELDTAGEFVADIIDTSGAAVGYTIAADIVSGTLTDIETKIDTIAANIATGSYTITINIKDGAAENIQGVAVQVHNAANDDSPRFGPLTTDASGNVSFDLDDATYSLRAVLAGYTLDTPITFTVAGSSATVNKTMTAVSISAPANPLTSTAYLSVVTGAGVVVTSGITLKVSTSDNFTRDVSTNQVSNATQTMVYNSGNELWEAEVIRGVRYKITSEAVYGLDDDGSLISHEFTGASATTTNLGTAVI